MTENILLLSFLLIPCFLGLLLFFFFKRAKTKGRSKSKLIAGNLLLLLFLLSILIACGEIYFRFAYDSTESYARTKVTLKWIEKHYQMNSNGLRDSVEEYRLRRTPGKRRILFIGDSFTAGHGVPNVEDRFANIIRKKYPEAETHIFAKNGMNTDSGLRMINDLTKQGYEFDEVILVYCLNDSQYLVPGYKQMMRKIFAPPSPAFLFENSFMLDTLYFRLIIAGNPTISDYHSFVIDTYAGKRWNEHKKRLKEFSDVIKRSKDGGLTVVTFPFLHSLGENYKFRDAHDSLDQFWRSLGVPHLDLLPVFEARRDTRLVVNPHDAHPNEAAHKIAAEAIGSFLDSDR
ncbi:MAG: SGNH/GDSL hydrolase family protein [Thermodesulfobacteriota bacterium]